MIKPGPWSWSETFFRDHELDIIHRKLSLLIFSHTLTQIKFTCSFTLTREYIPTDSQPLPNTLRNSITCRGILSPSFMQMSTLTLTCFYAQTCSYIHSNLDTLKSNPRTLIQSSKLRCWDFSLTWIIHTENCFYIHSHVSIHMLIHIWMPSHSHIYEHTHINTCFNKVTHTYAFIHTYTQIYTFTKWAYSYFNMLKHTKASQIYLHKGKFHVNAHTHIQ